MISKVLMNLNCKKMFVLNLIKSTQLYVFQSSNHQNDEGFNKLVAKCTGVFPVVSLNLTLHIHFH